MESGLKLGYALLAYLPFYITLAGFWTVTVIVLYPMRWCFEGAPYNTAFSSAIGDLALIGILLIAAKILKENSSIVPPLLAWKIHGAGAVLAVIIGALFVAHAEKEIQWTDLYHHVVVAPLLTYFLVISAFVIFGAGSMGQIGAALALFAFWGILVGIDVYTGRIDQRNWLKEHRPETYNMLK